MYDEGTFKVYVLQKTNYVSIFKKYKIGCNFHVCFYLRSGRRVTSQGTRDLDRIAGQVRGCRCF